MAINQENRITEDDELTPEELEIAQWAQGLSPEQVPDAIACQLSQLQQVPSYVETMAQLFANEQ